MEFPEPSNEQLHRLRLGQMLLYPKLTNAPRKVIEAIWHIIYDPVYERLKRKEGKDNE